MARQTGVASANVNDAKLQPLRIIGTPRAHDALLRLLAAETPGRILDVPCGTGVLSAWLSERGWEVTCADIDGGNFQLKEAMSFKQVDLNRALPFPDHSFDSVVCANGIHRVFNARGAIVEMARILRPGGKLFLNMNNYATASNRVRALICGTPSHIFDQEAFKQAGMRPEDAPEAHVRIPIVYSQVAAYMESAGLKVITERASDRPMKYVITNVLGCPVWLIAQFAALQSRDSTSIRRNAIPPVVFGGRYLAVVAEKE